jgi:acyl-CoA thioesterase I
MKKIYYLFLVCVAIALVWFFFFKQPNFTNYPPKGQNIIAFGDSLVQGIGATSDTNFVSKLSEKINQPIINAGVSGNTTSEALERIEEDVLSKDPKIVIVLLGGNDYLRRVDRKVTFSNLQKIVDMIHQKGSMVLLLGVRGGLLKDNYKDDFDVFAKRNNIAYVPNVLDDILGNEELMFDQVHPNEKGYEVIAEKVLPVLEKLLK